MIRRLPALLVAMLLSACQVPTSETVADRCDGTRDDEQVALAIKQSPERLRRLRAERSLTNELVCTMPAPLLSRAIHRVDQPKPGSPGEWAKWRAMGQRDDTGEVRPNGLAEAMAQRQAIIEQTRARNGGLVRPLAGLDSTRWSSLGPANIPGRVRAVVVHPSDGNRIWVGAVSGGIWYTADGGSSWRPLNDFQSNLAIASLVIDPSNTNVLYAGTGEGFFNVDAVRGAGIFRSTAAAKPGSSSQPPIPPTTPTGTTSTASR